MTLYRMNEGRRGGFGHRHDRAEEMYVVLSGSGRVKIDDDILDLRPLDVVRVAPASVREFDAGPDGMHLLAFGTHFKDDGEAGAGVVGGLRSWRSGDRSRSRARCPRRLVVWWA